MAKTLWDELCRFNEMLTTNKKLDTKSPRYSTIVAAVTKLQLLLECQHPQTHPVLRLSAARRGNRKK